LWGNPQHTYVTSDQGDSWGCWGGSSGGTSICSGSGSVPRARCLAGPFGIAGIIYGVTGVCHQTANRILFPAGVTVYKAGGYWASLLVYGVYGTNTVAWLASLGTCYAIIPAFKKPASARKKQPAKQPRVRAADTKTKAFMANVLALHESGLANLGRPDLKALAGKETGLLLDHLAPKPLTTAVKNNIIRLRQQNDDRLRALADMVHAGKIDGPKFAADGNAAITGLFSKLARTLGAQAYTDMFGQPPQVEVKLIDPEMAAKSFSNG